MSDNLAQTAIAASDHEADGDSHLDADELRRVQLLVFGKLEGAMTSAMIVLGDELGLYRALAASSTPPTIAELAGATGLHERWVREWAHNQSAAGVVGSDADGERLWLTPEAAAVLADDRSEAFGAGQFQQLAAYFQALGPLVQSFRTGAGHDYDSHGRAAAVGMERSFEPWHRRHLLADVLPALDGVVAALEAGAGIADVGCGAGGAVLQLAEAFPASTVVGYDTSRHALARAGERLAAAGLHNARFADPRTAPMPTDHSLRLVTMFDCLHDMTRPHEVADAVRQALGDDGTWLLVDIKARDTYAENVERNPMAAMMYAISVVTCLSSGLAEPGGAGLGTLGLSESRARQIAATAGFTRFRRLAVDHPINAFYEIRP